MNRIHIGVPPASGPQPVAAGAVVAGGIPALIRFARRASMASLELLILWQDRASQRQHLSMIDGDVLRDVGLRRADLAPEIRKPFWRA
jgi:uncharacterized protein YjiS (DUF1127 family)